MLNPVDKIIGLLVFDIFSMSGKLFNSPDPIFQALIFIFFRISTAFNEKGEHKKIKPNFSAKGLKEANEKLDAMKLPEKERKAYDAYLRHLMSIASRNHTIEIDAKEIIC